VTRWPTLHSRGRATVTPNAAPLTGRRVSRPAMVVGVLVYRGVTTADVDLPVAELADRLDADVVFVGSEIGVVHGVEPSRAVVVDIAPTAGFLPDVLVIPGGLGWRQVIGDEAIVRWLTAAGRQAKGVLAISTGSLLLGSVGLLEGEDATGHWLAAEDLAKLGATVQTARVALADRGRVVTAAGAGSAIGAARQLADSIRWAEHH
jgi:transcriptional regulator GlxA family with amidase domain